MPEDEASLFEVPFAYAKDHVQPTRVGKREKRTNEMWWIFQWSRPIMRKAIADLSRFIVTPEVSKHRVFKWLIHPIVPDKNLIVIARSDDTTFGILHSRFHELWSLKMCTWLGKGNDPRYTPTTTFETFPFPVGLTPNLKPEEYTNPQAEAIAEAARNLNQLRENWLNPPEWIDRVPEVVEGYPDRLIPRPEFEKELKKRTLTNLYNQPPAWLDNAHRKLDQAVAAAYGWQADIPDEEVLRRLLALNLERAGQQA
jgi:type II restriction/modification system DNA methylase subunit YeeA